MPTTQSWWGEGQSGTPWNATMTSTQAQPGFNPGMDMPGVQNGVATHPGAAGGYSGAPGMRDWGGMGSMHDLAGFKGNAMSAVGTPYEQFITGGNGNGPVDFNRPLATMYMRSGGMTGPGAHRAAFENRRAMGPMVGPNAGTGAQAPMGSDMTTTYPPQASTSQPWGAGPYPGTYPKPPTGMAHIDGAGMPPQSAPGGYVPMGQPNSTVGFSPFLGSQINALAQQYGQQLNRNVLPAIQSHSIGAGTYGSAKEGVAEGIAAGDASSAFAREAMGLLGGDWTNQQNRNLTNQGQMLNFSSDQRAQDRADLLAGAGLYDQGTQGQWNPIRNANGVYGQYTGFGTQTGQQGGGAMGAIGGGLAGALLARNLGWGT